MIARVPIQTIGEDVLAPFMAQNSELGQFYQFRVQAATEEARSQIRYGNLSSGAELLERAITDASDAADDEQTRWIVGIAFSVLGQGLEAWGKKHDAIEYFNRAVDEFTTARGDAELTAATRDLPAARRSSSGLLVQQAAFPSTLSRIRPRSIRAPFALLLRMRSTRRLASAVER